MGTILVGITCVVGSFVAIFVIKVFKRRTLVLTQHAVCTILFLLLGFFIIYDLGVLSLISILLFLFMVQNGDGALCWMYATEVVIDSGLGFVFFGLKGSGLLISLTTEFLMDSALGPEGVFWMYSTICAISGVYCLLLMKETYGLTDAEKKELYREDCGAWICAKKPSKS